MEHTNGAYKGATNYWSTKCCRRGFGKNDSIFDANEARCQGNTNWWELDNKVVASCRPTANQSNKFRGQSSGLATNPKRISELKSIYVGNVENSITAYKVVQHVVDKLGLDDQHKCVANMSVRAHGERKKIRVFYCWRGNVNQAAMSIHGQYFYHKFKYHRLHRFKCSSCYSHSNGINARCTMRITTAALYWCATQSMTTLTHFPPLTLCHSPNTHQSIVKLAFFPSTCPFRMQSDWFDVFSQLSKRVSKIDASTFFTRRVMIDT